MASIDYSVDVHLQMSVSGNTGLMRLVGLDLDLVAGRQEGVEANNKLRVALHGVQALFIQFRHNRV